MINTLLVVLLAAVSAYALGWFHRETSVAIKDLQERLKKQEPPIGATLGTYAPVSEFRRTNQPGEVGLVESKTPQRVEYEAEQALRRESRGE